MTKYNKNQLCYVADSPVHGRGLFARDNIATGTLIGHYDKMIMDGGEPAMRAEFERIAPIIKAGGFIPSVDHQTPPNVSLENYRIYLKLLNEYTSC